MTDAPHHTRRHVALQIVANGATPWFPWVKREMSLGNIVMILTMLAAIGSGLFEGGMIRATLENGIKAEAEIRVLEVKYLNGRLDGISADIREVRTEARENRAR